MKNDSALSANGHYLCIFICGRTDRFCLKYFAGLKPLLDVTVDVLDINDNLPEFRTDQPLVWRVAPEKRRKYSIVGKAVANDADGDDITYSFSDQVTEISVLHFLDVVNYFVFLLTMDLILPGLQAALLRGGASDWRGHVSERPRRRRFF